MRNRLGLLAVLGAMVIAGCGGGGATEEELAQCKSAVTSVPNLKEATKTKLEGICDDAKDGDEDDLKAAAKEVCETIIEDQVPAAQQATAKQSCEDIDFDQ